MSRVVALAGAGCVVATALLSVVLGLPPLLAATIVLYAGSSLLLFGFGANLAAFAFRVLRRGRKVSNDVELLDDDDLPLITVQLPIYNELYVSERIIAAACELDWPADKLQIQVLDDSTDETTVLISQIVADLQHQGHDIVHIHRTDRSGYKAGALAAGLESATGEFAAIFDADFVPPPDFLRRTVGRFADEGIAFVQARWGHLNRDYSPLTQLQALAIDGHFLVEQAGRGEAGYWFNFNGTAGVWRISAIADAGGWTADTLTEDLDLSYRAYLAGWRADYVEDLVVPAELPAQMSGFRRQQHRWARGSLECAARLLPRVWRAKVGLGTKLQATIHLLAYGIHLLLLLLTLIYPLVLETAMTYPALSTMSGLAYLLAVSSLAPTLFFVTGRHQSGLPWVRELPRILLVSIFGSGLMVNTARALIDIFRHPNPEFERTAKFGIDAGPVEQAQNRAWARKRYQLDIDRIVFFEAILGVYSLWTSTQAIDAGHWGIAVWAFAFGAGLLMVVATTVVHALAVHVNRQDRKAAIHAERAALAMTDAADLRHVAGPPNVTEVIETSAAAVDQQ